MLMMYVVISSLLTAIMSIGLIYYLKVHDRHSLILISVMGIGVFMLTLAFPFVYRALNLGFSTFILFAAAIAFSALIILGDNKAFHFFKAKTEHNDDRILNIPPQMIYHNDIRPAGPPAQANHETIDFNELKNTIPPLPGNPEHQISKDSEETFDIDALIDNISLEHTVDWDKIGMDPSFHTEFAQQAGNDSLHEKKISSMEDIPPRSCMTDEEPEEKIDEFDIEEVLKNL
ncbi:MAG: hypothetical protein MJB12_07150 [Firmicutes bacterium]|nr:hypothetical protein [Bacillota bacterium]